MYGLHESTTANIADFLAFYLIQISIPTALLVITPKKSPLRYLAIPCMIWIANRFMLPFAPAGGPAWCQAICQLVIVVLQAINLLLLNPVGRQDLTKVVKNSQSTISYFFAATRALIFTRGVNTPWQVKNIPSQPRYYARRGMQVPSRSHFLLRQSVILAWQYLALDIIQTLSAQQASERKEISWEIHWNVSCRQWGERAGTHLAIWFVVNRLIGDSAYRLLSIVSVGLGNDSPSDWPPAWGRMKEAYTLRNFWGTFWHQFMRQPFSALGKFIARDLLGLARSSVLERYTNLFVVFLVSSLYHVIVDLLQSVPPQYSGSITFYMIFVAGIMLEDFVQHLWGRFGAHKRSSSSEKIEPAMWQRIIGLMWVMTWLAVTSTWYFTPMIQLTGPDVTMVPFSFSAKSSLPTSGTLLLSAGIVISWIFEVDL
ncbi:uncharacterized protein N7484_009428 [Penicillium longicatenatum]|uniref:uncharacterized protein n=1 Tax=Penicillium longicatenatum TaxID=1561947 RepID=UPI0025482805|nr:uncharacterized protein N7484_009428 [Penicillium longicatenatum]KAJ5636115.1 hypothetical protein N7484_009428 [Penicillium longicatenatum]